MSTDDGKIERTLELLAATEINPTVRGHLERAAAEITHLREALKAAEERLEVDPSHPYDGIDARDETIRQLEARLSRPVTEEEVERASIALYKRRYHYLAWEDAPDNVRNNYRRDARTALEAR